LILIADYELLANFIAVKYGVFNCKNASLHREEIKINYGFNAD
jgi:hypothetical protein